MQKSLGSVGIGFLGYRIGLFASIWVSFLLGSKACASTTEVLTAAASPAAIAFSCSLSLEIPHHES